MFRIFFFAILYRCIQSISANSLVRGDQKKQVEEAFGRCLGTVFTLFHRVVIRSERAGAGSGQGVAVRSAQQMQRRSLRPTICKQPSHIRSMQLRMIRNQYLTMPSPRSSQ
jgi:hypothetical protein